MPPLAGDRLHGRRQRALGSFQLPKRLLALFAIGVEYPNAGVLAGRQADVEIARAPPAADDVWIDGGALEIVGNSRLFLPLGTREYPHAFGGERGTIGSKRGDVAEGIHHATMGSRSATCCQ